MSIIMEGAEMGMDGGLISKGTDLVATLWEMLFSMSTHWTLCLLCDDFI